MPDDFDQVMAENYPSLDLGQFPADVGPDRIQAEILVLSDRPGVYSLVGEKVLGRSPLNDLGLTVIMGLLPGETDFTSVIWTEPDGGSYELNAADLGLDGPMTMTVWEGPLPTMYAVLDLTAGNETAEMLSGARFQVLDRLSYLQLQVDEGWLD